MPGFHAQVAADGVHLVRVQVYAHVLQIFKQGAARKLISPVAQGPDVLLAGGVVFVFNVAHDFFQHVFDGDQAGGAAVLVQCDGNVLLAGAEFELKQNGEALKFKKLSDGHYAVDPAGETKLVTGEQDKMKGKIIIDGLNVGDYTLKETKAPDNFNLMQGEKDVTITQNGDALEKHLLANTNNKEHSKSAYWYQTVVDKRISGLPATGGMGTTIFMVAGIAVMACAVVALMVVLKRQKRSEG